MLICAVVLFKMKALKTMKLLFTIFGICLLPEANTKVIYFSLLVYISVLTVAATYIYMSIWYIISEMSRVEVEILLYAALQIVAITNTILPYIWFSIRKNMLLEFVNRFQSVVNESVYFATH